MDQNVSSNLVGLYDTVQALTAGQYLTINPRVNDQPQLQFVISNNNERPTSNAYKQKLFVTDMAGRLCIPIWPETSVTIEMDGPFRVKCSELADTTVYCVVAQKVSRKRSVR